jgi:DNA repair protein RadC
MKNWACYRIPAPEKTKAQGGKAMTYQIVSERRLKREVTIVNPAEAYELVKRYAGAKQEQFILLTLNGSHSVISVSIVSIGIVNKAIVHPREVFRKAIIDNAAAIIVCHNHPSGSVKPSDEDREATGMLSEAGKIIGIQLIDHIIFSKTGYTSLKSEGNFPNKR